MIWVGFQRVVYQLQPAGAVHGKIQEDSSSRSKTKVDSLSGAVTSGHERYTKARTDLEPTTEDMGLGVSLSSAAIDLLCNRRLPIFFGALQ